MNKIKRAYYYFFYKIYKFTEYTSEQFGGAFWTDFKAGVVMGVLEIWFCVSLINYYNIFIDRYFKITKEYFIIMGIIIFVINYLAFVNNDKWKFYNAEFNQLPKMINKKGDWVVFGIVFFIIANLIFSFYLRFQINWQLYR